MGDDESSGGRSRRLGVRGGGGEGSQLLHANAGQGGREQRHAMRQDKGDAGGDQSGRVRIGKRDTKNV